MAGADELASWFEDLQLSGDRGEWHAMGEVMHRGTGWCFRDPSCTHPFAELPNTCAGSWILQGRRRPVGTRENVPEMLQFVCVWEGLDVPLHWCAQAPHSLDTASLVLYEARHFRRDDEAGEELIQYRGFHAVSDGDQWMLAGLRCLDASPRRSALPLNFTVDPTRGWWFDTEPIIVTWDAAFLPDGRACALRWTLPVEGVGGWGDM